MIIELMNAPPANVLATLQESEIPRELAVRTGAFFSRFTPSAALYSLKMETHLVI
jgi:hypothetical protein